MAQLAESTPAGTNHPMGEVPRPIILVNLPKLAAEIETTTQLVQDCLRNNGNIYTLDDNSDDAYAHLDERAIPILEDLHRTLQSKLQRMTTYATAVPDRQKQNYNNIHANAVSAIITAEVYLQSNDMEPDYLLCSDPDAPMDVDNMGEQTPSEAATIDNPETHNITKSNEAHDDTPDQVADDVILELNIREDEIDQLYTVVNPSELSTTDALRDRADSLHHESVNTGPADDDIEMVKTLQE